MLDIVQIEAYHKHRFPYLLVDFIEEIEPGKSVRGYKNFSENEWLFHCSKYDNQPVPFTMVVEVLTEMFLMPILTFENNKGKITNFISADNVEIYKDIYPGDRMDIKAEVKSWKRGIAKGIAEGYVNEELACSAELTFVIPDTLDLFKPQVDH